MKNLALAVFVVTVLCSTTHAKVLDKTLAVVQGKAILLSDLQDLRKQVQQSPLLRNFYNVASDISEQALLDRLVEDQIVRTRLKELSAEVSGDSVNREIEEIARKNKISVPQLKKVLRQQGVDFENYFEALKSNLERRAIFHREIQTSGSTMTEEELKSNYKSKAPPEFKLALIVDNPGKKNQQLLEQIKGQFKAGKIPPEKLKESPGYVDLGWVPSDQVADEFKKLISAARAGDAFGPLKKGTQLQLLLVENSRRGSDEQFNEVKEQFRDSLENEETDKKFKIWIEKKKNELEVIVNPI